MHAHPLLLLAAALKARQRLFYAVLAATLAATLLLSLLLPKTYVATAEILADGKREQALNPGAPLYERERTGYLQTQADILTSLPVARRAAAILALEGDAALQAAFQRTDSPGRFEDWIGEQLLKNIKVSTSPGSVLRVSASADDPRNAARLANAFTQGFLDHTLALHVEPLKKAALWFDGQLSVLREEVDLTRRRLSDFQREQGVLAGDEQHDVESLRLLELSTLSARAAAAPPAATGEVRAVAELRSVLTAAETKLAELSAEFGPGHPRVVRQQAEADALKARLAAAEVDGSRQTRQRSGAEQQRRRELQSELGRQRERVGSLREAHTRLAVLRSDYTNAQRAYDLAVQRAVASRIDSRAALPEASLLSEAVPPARPARPRPLLNLGIAAVLGTLLGLLAVHLAESADRRLRRSDELALDRGLPLLAVLDDDRRRLAGPLPPERPAGLPALT